MVSGLVANVVIIGTILKNKSLRTPMNMDLVSLAFADAIVCVFVIPIRLALYNSDAVLHGEYLSLCKGEVFLKTLCDSVQTFMLVATSFERYKSIAKPFDTKGNYRRTLIIVISVWIVCSVLAIFCTFSFPDGATFYPCYIRGDMKRKAVDIPLLAPRFFREGILTLPVGIVCIVNIILFYGLMMRVLREHTTTMRKKKVMFKNAVSPQPSVKASNSRLKSGDFNINNGMFEDSSKFNTFGVGMNIPVVRYIESDTTNNQNERFCNDAPVTKIKISSIITDVDSPKENASPENCEGNLAESDHQHARSDFNEKSTVTVTNKTLVKLDSLSSDW
ncbi:hypothetical protein DPMN_160217 [Dreissena polymorpha]|uniref:G-protein coupled receptors family 1 profile domain-containing protein n=1 Tax=Dreissena polymorpha TaxID=45954 RepID=A0A9D4EMC9_DREPO|nr:hypothetical protein DPMN_160217 [Dreissena polymorpha]